MSVLQIEDLQPDYAEFKLRQTNKVYHLKPLTLADEIWMAKTFGADIHAIFTEMRMEEICRIVFRLMTEDDKKDFLRREVTFINEEGDEIKQRVGGADLLLCLITGVKEKVDVLNALLKTIGLSRPAIEKLEEQEAQKKSQESQPTGLNSLTSSQPSMDGAQNTSSLEHLEKSTGELEPLAKEGA